MCSQTKKNLWGKEEGQGPTGFKGIQYHISDGELPFLDSAEDKTR